ncbi:MAG: hypothetical protein WCS30_12040 [Selenomonadaceae bacterium]
MKNEKLEKVIALISDRPEYKFETKEINLMVEDVNKMFDAGWDNLADGIVVTYKENIVGVKQGRKMIVNEMEWSHITRGILDGQVKKVLGEKEITEEKAESMLLQAILTKYWTPPISH